MLDWNLPANDGWVDSKSFLHVLYEVIVPPDHVLARFNCTVWWFLFLLHYLFWCKKPIRLNWSLSNPRSSLVCCPIPSLELWIVLLVVNALYILCNPQLNELILFSVHIHQSFSTPSCLLHLRRWINCSILPTLKWLHSTLSEFLTYPHTYRNPKIIITCRPLSFNILSWDCCSSLINFLLLFELTLLKSILVSWQNHRLVSQCNHWLFRMNHFVRYFKIVVSH